MSINNTVKSLYLLCCRTYSVGIVDPSSPNGFGVLNTRDLASDGKIVSVHTTLLEAKNALAKAPSEITMIDCLAVKKDHYIEVVEGEVVDTIPGQESDRFYLDADTLCRKIDGKWVAVPAGERRRHPDTGDIMTVDAWEAMMSRRAIDNWLSMADDPDRPPNLASYITRYLYDHRRAYTCDAAGGPYDYKRLY